MPIGSYFKHNFTNSMVNKILFFLVLILTNFCAAFAQLEKDIPALFQELENQPGGIIGVFKKGEIDFFKAYGLANLDYDIPITSKTVFDVGSVSKQFTAACVFLLEQQGKLSIDDPIQKYLPEMPIFRNETVTIRNLLNHTSGLRDYVEINAYAGVPFENIFTEEMGLDIMTRQQDRNFPPGQQFMYNNGGYLLLAIIIRRVAGESIGKFAQKHLFEPLGMKSSFILENPNRIVKNSATGYVAIGDNMYEKKHFYNIALGGDGQLYTTLEDLLLWDNNFYTKKIGGQALYDRQHQKGVLNNGESIEYAGGLFVQEYKGYEVVQHTGSWGGFISVFYRFPSLGKTLVVLANSPSFLNGSQLFGLIDLMIPNEKQKQKIEEASHPNISVQLSARQLQKYTGLFSVKEQPHLRLRSTLLNDTLSITQLWDEVSFQLVPTSKNTFFRKGLPIIRFVFNEETGAPIVHERIAVWHTEKVDQHQTKPDLSNYVGEYYSEEVGVRYTINIENKQLVVFRNKKKIKTLVPVTNDVFGNHFQGYQFARNKGKISGFLIQDRRIRNLQFTKINR